MSLINAMTFQAGDTNGNVFNIALNGVLSGSALLNKTGGGTLTLGAADTYSGSTIISGGTLALGSAGSVTSPNIIVGTNAILDVSAVGGGFTLTGSQILKGFGTVNGLVSAASGATIFPGSNSVAGTLTLAGGLTEAGGVYNSFIFTNDPASTNNSFLNVPGTLTVSGANPILISGTVLAGGVYPLISYGTLNGSAASFTASGASGIVSNNASTKTLYFVAKASVRAPTNVTWLGNLTVNNWDTEITTNWLNNGTAQLDIFVPGDNVLFGTQGAVHPLVNVAGSVTPGSITVTTNYTFAGTGSIGGGGLTVSNGTLTILTTNNYSGPTVINGVLVTPNIAPSGSPSGIGAATTDPANLVLNGGTLVYDGSSANTDHGITLTNAGGTFDVANGAVLTFYGALTGGGALTKTDGGTLILDNTDTYAGITTIDGGIVQISAAGSLSATNIVFSNGTLAYNPSAGLTLADPFNFTAGTTNMIIVTSGSGGNPVSSGVWSGGGVVLVSNTFNPFTVNGVLDAFTGTISLATPNAAGFRFNSGGGNTCFGSTNATFDLGTNSAVLTCRNAGGMNLGALEGGPNTSVAGQGSDSGTVVWSIGNNNLSTTFAGTINNGSTAARISAVTKVGTGTLTLEGLNTYTGPTVIDSGVLALAFNATNDTDGAIGDSSPIQLTAGAVLSVSGRSDGTFPLGSSQTLDGPGLIRGSLDASGIVAPEGTITVTNGLTLESSCTVDLNLNRATTPNSDRLVANSITNNGATLVVNNAGPALQTGDTFTLFSSPAFVNNSAFASITLPTLTGTQYWNTNSLTVNGTITVAVPAPLSFNGITTSGNSIVLNATGGTPGGPVTILSSTSLTLPLSQWTTVNSGNFDGNGNFSYTVSGALSSGQPQQFFMLQQ
jgi:fibronectin-binding autotransporter adhesin